MGKNIVDRINELARKAKNEGLTEEEKQEQKVLREKYIAAFRQSLTAALDSMVLVDTDGNMKKLRKMDIPQQ
ncbi:MAG: DUF896 domain-containing protein [Clostridiaceae bacterium]|nr:DUF896 domain-containing protein [Clostridiaceae bacterium]